MPETPTHGAAFDLGAVIATDGWIRRLSRSLVGTDCEADDLGQDAWLAVLKAGPDAVECSRSWLARVLANAARRRHREARRRLRREHAAARLEGQSSPPHEALARVELRRQVLEAVLALREPYRSAVVLRFFEDLSLKQVAAAEGVPLNTVKTRVSRGLEILRRRLDGRYGKRAAWVVLFLPWIPGTSARGAAAAGGVPWTLVKQGALATMSTKTVVSSLCLSAALAAVLGVASYRAWREMAEATPAGQPRQALRSSRIENGRGSPERAPAGEDAAAVSPRPAEPHAGLEAARADSPGEESPAVPAPAAGDTPAGAEALAARAAFAALKKSYGDGGGEGWRAIAKHVAELQVVLLSSGEGFAEFLALLDAETDASFLEALLHHLPQADTESRAAIVEDHELGKEIWSRFEQAEDPLRRLAFLRFFAFNRQLSAARMGTFLEVARNDPAARVRELGLDAIASHRELLADTWETLADAVENDPAPECRETAIRGLAGVQAERAAALVLTAFSSPDERLRAAAWTSAAGEDPPAQVTGGDPVAYLVSELRAASSRRYKQVLLRRLLERAPHVLEAEINRALPAEPDWGVRKDYREALQRIAGSRESRSE